ncbi:unnamed protein product [Rotaria socialis]|uniref:Uncharacterized protein n=1 Tax=Rotaria socialis TaxID=392032 RepID=A0A818ASL3_9BILA|nr:unnamed protein product [Rotaria socialis]CAF4582611.1 unnamed protein product [Rotaria socialis]CAF4697045.1 unnamed protein product [Rotaria socialis]
MAADMNEYQGNYIGEYGDFLDKEIKRNFKHITKLEQSDLSQYSEDLNSYFQALSSLDRYELVFESRQGGNKIEHWHREFFNYYHFLENHIEVCKISGKNEELKNLLIIAQALSCLARVCKVIFKDNGFRVLYWQYRLGIAKSSREAYKQAMDYLFKGDYTSADLALSDIVEKLPDSTFLKQIKYELQLSLEKLIGFTETSAHCKTDQILATAILNGIKNIELFISNNHFLPAEQYKKLEELQARFNTLHIEILQRCDFTDIDNYCINPPKDLFSQLKKAVSGGYAKYTSISNTLMEKLRLNFSLAIDKVREISSNDRSTKVRSIKVAFLFLPEELKTVFQAHIDELN